MNDVVVNTNHSLFKDSSEFVNDPEGYARFVIRCIPTMSAQDLDLTARQAFRIEGAGFIIRILCVARLVNLAISQSGGRGNRDEEGRGVNATLRKLAEQWKLDIRTLQTDRAIYREFFEERFETSGVDATSFCGLGREYFRIALTVASPRTAIEMAIEKHLEGSYSVRQFAKDVGKMPRKNTAKGRSKKQGIKMVLDQQTVENLDALLESERSGHPEECATRELFFSFLIRKLRGAAMA